MLNHLPILQVIVPLMGAPACLILGRTKLAWLFALLVSGLALLVAGLLLMQVYQYGPMSYELGGWAAPWGIEYRIDLLNAWLLLIVSLSSTVCLVAAQHSIQREIADDKQLLFYVAWLLCLAGLLGILATGDAFNVFVFLEISSLSSYTLISLGKQRQALWSAYSYLIMGTIGATLILIGIGLMYAMTGTLNMADLAQRLPAATESPAVMTAFVLIVIGTGLKLALLPLHFWLPNAYTFAPSIVTAFLAASSTKVAIYLLIRFSYTVFDGGPDNAVLPLSSLLLVLGTAAVFAASTSAIYQSNIKRSLAYSSVGQVGYMVMGLGIGGLLGLQATLLHLFNHALMKIALFLSLAAVAFSLGSTQLRDLHGLGKRMPLTALAFTLGGLSLIGVPLTSGFVSKWYLVSAALQADLWPLAMLVVFGSLLALAYIWRVVEAMYFKPVADNASTGEAPLLLLLPLWLMVAANLYFGIDTRLPVSVTNQAAQWLLGSAP